MSFPGDSEGYSEATARQIISVKHCIYLMHPQSTKLVLVFLFRLFSAAMEV